MKGGKGGKGQERAHKQKNEIVPWGWEEAAKAERKKKVAERSAAEAAAKAAKELKDMGLDDKPKVKKQPDAAVDKAVADKAAAKAAAAAAAAK
eukprot:scaffold13.g327.t1